MYSIYDQINNRKVLVYPERTTVNVKTTDSVLLTNEQIASTYFPEDHDVKPEIYFDKVEIGEGNFIYNGDNIQVLKTLPDNSVDSVVTDPPYGLKFMGKQWDYDVPSVELWKECYRVLKPGGYLLSFGSSRTYHRMAVKVEDAGFEIRDQIMWVYGSGFPKSHNVGKAVDKILGNEREIISIKPNHKKGMNFKYDNDRGGWLVNDEIVETKGSSEWEGFGTALKPAHEPIVMARKPFKGSVAENVLKWNTGGINIDKCRIGDDEIITNGYGKKGFVASENYSPSKHIGRFPANIILDHDAGKLLDFQTITLKNEVGMKSNQFHEPIVVAKKPIQEKSIASNVIKWGTGGINIDKCRVEFEDTKDPSTNPLYRQENNYKMPKKGEESNGAVSFTSSKNKISSLGRFPANIIFDDITGEILDEQSGITSQGHWPDSKTAGFGDFGNGDTLYYGVGQKDNIKGGASRFFYCPKPSKREREEGLTNEAVIIEGRDEGQDKRKVPQKLRNTNRRNTHTTVKPVALMQYLIRLVTPIGGTTIDPFLGSGTSSKATIKEGNFKFIGIEKEKEYFDISVERCQYEYQQSLKVAA